MSASTAFRFKFTLNWKNSYKLENGVKTASKYGLGCDSYNMWRGYATKSQKAQFCHAA